jgi:hypothetical protein
VDGNIPSTLAAVPVLKCSAGTVLGYCQYVQTGWRNSAIRRQQTQERECLSVNGHSRPIIWETALFHAATDMESFSGDSSLRQRIRFIRKA